MFAIVLLAAAYLPATADTAPTGQVTCSHTDGMIDGPHVGSAITARRIARAIIEDMESAERQQRYVLHIEDGGDHWIAFQSVRGYPRREGDNVIVMAGGGGLDMVIAKCDGAISQMHWSR